MNRKQSEELFTLITRIRHVDELNPRKGPYLSLKYPDEPACVLAEGMRHGLFTLEQVRDDVNKASYKFHQLFGCSLKEEKTILFDENRDRTQTGEIVYQAGKELLLKYGYDDLFEGVEKGLPFHELMDQMNEKEHKTIQA